MIKSGIDIIQISRVAEKINKNSGFLDIILTEQEKKYCNSRVGSVSDDAKKYQSVAGIYAVKEAFFKAIGCGIKSLSDLKNVEVRHFETGEPYLKILNPNILNCLKEKFISTSISISHDGDMAVAICMLETQ